MAQEEIIFKVGVDTGDSVQDVNKVGDAFDNVKKKVELSGRSLAELQDEFKKVTNELKALNPNSKEFGELAEKARALKNEMKAVGNSLNDTTDHTKKSFVGLRQELKQLTVQLQNLDPASKEFETVARRAGQIKEQMRGVADAINDADPEKFGGKFQRTAEGIAGAFSAVTGAQALFGQQSEEIEKQMLKVQGAIALTQGISAMKELKNDATDFAMSIKNTLVGAFKSLSVAQIANATETSSLTALQKVYTLVVGTSTGALKAFKIALASTGIGLLIVGLGFLISKLMDTFKSTEEIIKINEKLLRSNERIISQIDRRREAIDRDLEKQLAYADAYGKSEEDKYNITKKFNGKTIEENNKEIQVRLENVKKLKAIDLGAQASSKEQYLELVQQNKKRVVDEWAKINELKRANEDLNTNIETGQIKLNTQAEEERKKDNEDAIAKRREQNQKVLEQIHQANLKRIELENQRIAEQEKLENEYYDSFKTQQQLEEQAVRDKYFTIIQTTKDNETLKLAQQKELDAIALKYKEEADKQESDRLNNIGQQYEDFVTQYTEAVNSASENEKLAVNDKYNYLIEKAKEYGFSTVELEKKRAAELKEIDKELLQAKEKFVSEVSNMLGALASASQQGSSVQKAFAVAQVAVDTAKSISSVIAGATAAAAAGGPAAPFLIGGYIASGIATVTTAMSSVKKLLNAPLPSTQAPNINRPNENTQGTQQGTPQTIQAQSTYKVVVVDSDITKMQDKTKKVNAISTI